MAARKSAKSASLLARLAKGPVICAEGYLFEFERRGYLQAGAFVPEIVLEHPDLVEQLHREFVHAGSDVVEAFTYYAHRAKLRLIGREKDLKAMNLTALKLARKVARDTGTLFAGDICNTNIYDPKDSKSEKAVRAMFEEQVGWAADAGAWPGPACRAADSARDAGVPAGTPAVSAAGPVAPAAGCGSWNRGSLVSCPRCWLAAWPGEPGTDGAGAAVATWSGLAGSCSTQPGQTTDGLVNVCPSPMRCPRLRRTIS